VKKSQLRKFAHAVSNILKAHKFPSIGYMTVDALMSKKQIAAIFLLMIMMISIFPLIWFKYLPLIDYPRHLATLQIHQTFSTNINVQKFYAFRWIFIPNLGLDLLATPLLPFLTVEVIGKIVIVFTLLSIYVGTILLNKDLNPNNWGPSAFSGMFLYNGAFEWGFLNYIIGVGFAIWAFWLWVRYRDRVLGISILAFIVLGVVIGLMHFYALAIYAVCVAGYECSVLWEKLRGERRLQLSHLAVPIRAAVIIILPMLALLLPVASGRGPLVWGRSLDSIVRWKGEALASVIYFHQYLEKPLVLVLLAILVWALATRTLVVNSRMVIPLAVFGVIFIVMPAEFWGTGLADYRLPSGVAFFAWASLGWGEKPRGWIAMHCLLFALCLVARVGSIFAAWRPAQPILAEYETALQPVPPGSRLLVIMDGSGWSNPPLVHEPLLAAAKRGVFISRHSISNIEIYDYLLEIRNPEVKIPAAISLKEVGHGQTFILYRIDKATEHRSNERWSGAALQRLPAIPPDPTIIVFPNGRESDKR
jgi:hypothetical protein